MKVEEVLPLYKSYITWLCDHLSVAAIGMSCDRKWNGYPLVGGVRSQIVISYFDMNGNRQNFKHRISPIFHNLVPWHLRTIVAA